MNKHITKPILYLTVLSFFLFARPAQAYLDPGTGSYITQVIVGLLAGGAYAVKVYWRQIIAFFKKLTKQPKARPKDEKDENE